MRDGGCDCDHDIAAIAAVAIVADTVDAAPNGMVGGADNGDAVVGIPAPAVVVVVGGGGVVVVGGGGGVVVGGGGGGGVGGGGDATGTAGVRALR